MSGHGVARTARSRTQQQRQADLDKISKYRSLEDQVREKTANGQYGQETFRLTSKLLRLNPEYYTVWNARRRCLISGSLSRPSAGSSHSKASPSSSAIDTPTPSSAALSPSSSKEIPQAPDSQTTGKSGTTAEGSSETQTSPSNSDQEQDSQVLRSELGFTIPLLMEFPKCYWIWGYRLWVLQQAIQRLAVATARQIWEEELGLVSKMLTKDRRNFHAWGYRRHVVAKLESPALRGQSLVASEFEYTTQKIQEDLSNFSAWHNRSQLILRLLDERKADGDSRRAFLDGELALVREALNVGPEDQSLWYYHQFLVLGLAESAGRVAIAPNLTVEERRTYIAREIEDIKDLLEDYQDIKWIYEALIQYTIAIGQLTGDALGKEEQQSISQWLDSLRVLDPMRRGRWNDLEKGLELGKGEVTADDL